MKYFWKLGHAIRFEPLLNSTTVPLKVIPFTKPKPNRIKHLNSKNYNNPDACNSTPTNSKWTHLCLGNTSKRLHL